MPSRPPPGHGAVAARRRSRVGPLTAAASLAWCALALAAPLAPPPMLAFVVDPASPALGGAATPAVFAIDPRRSSATFLVGVRMRGPAEGRFPGVTGDLQGSAASGWRVHVRLDAQGLRFDGPNWMERATRSPAFLAVDRYPSIRFDSDGFDDARLRAGGVLRGQLTLRGRRKAVAFDLLPSACARPGRDCDIRVRGAVDRRDFGMDAHRALVQDQVELHIQVRLRGAAP